MGALLSRRRRAEATVVVLIPTPHGGSTMLSLRLCERHQLSTSEIPLHDTVERLQHVGVLPRQSQAQQFSLSEMRQRERKAPQRGRKNLHMASTHVHG